MAGRLRLWVHAGLIALAAPAVGRADHCLTKPCATTPPVKIVVEMSPPEVTFKQAPAAAVKCPPKATVAPAPAGYYFPLPLPTQQPVYAPMYAPAYAPTYAPMAAPTFAPQFAPAPCGSPAGYGAAPACGSGAGLGASAADLRAAADALEVQERAALQMQMSFIDRQYATIAEKAKAAGLTPNFAPSAAPKASPAAAPKPAMIPPAGPESANSALKQIQLIEAEIAQLQGVLRAYKEAIERQGAGPGK